MSYVDDLDDLPLGSDDSNKKGDGRKRKSAEDHGAGDDEDESQKTKRRAQIAKAARKHRQRQKDELMFLRNKVNDLEEQITTIKSAEPTEQFNEPAWKQEARQQAEIRSKIDRENEFLRNTLVEQLSFTQKLQQLLTKQPLLTSSGQPMQVPIMSAANRLDPMVAGTFQSTVSVPSVGLLSSVETRTQRFIRIGKEAVRRVPQHIEKANQMLASAKEKFVCMGVEVQYSLEGNLFNVFIRKSDICVTAAALAAAIWESGADIQFNEKFSFVNSFDILDEIDENTRYQRVTHPFFKNSQINAEVLGIFRRDKWNGKDIFAFESVESDEKYPQNVHMFRQKSRRSLEIKPGSIGSLSEIRGCICTVIPQNLGLPSTEVTNVLWNNVLDTIPQWISAVIERAKKS